MLARRHGAGALGADLGLGVALGLAGMRGRRERRIGEARNPGRVGRDQRVLALVPGRQQLRIGQTADQAGMDQAGEIHAGDVTRRRIETLDVPDRFLCEVFAQRAKHSVRAQIR